MARSDIVEERDDLRRIERGIEMCVEIDLEVREEVRLGDISTRWIGEQRGDAGESMCLREICAIELLCEQRLDQCIDLEPIALRRCIVRFAQRSRWLRRSAGLRARNAGHEQKHDER